MKTIIKSSILLVLLTLVLFTNSAVQAANNNSYAPIQYSIYSVQDALTFRLTINNEESKVISVKIYNENGVLVYTDKITKSGVSAKTYDMTTQGAGIYNVELSVNGFKSIEMVKVGLPQAKKTIAGKLMTDFTSEIEKNANQGIDTMLDNFSENSLTTLIEENASKQR
jgi:hypothetical protein